MCKWESGLVRRLCDPAAPWDVMLQVPHSPGAGLEPLGAGEDSDPLQLLLDELHQWPVSRKWKCLLKNNDFAAVLYTHASAPSALSP